MSADILSLEQVSDDAVGGKAYGLSRLMAMGLAVPPAFVIRNAGVGSYPDDLDRQVRALACDRVAVRSSAQGEDGADASFAGQYDTVLNVAGGAQLRQAIDQCVASAEADHATRYRVEKAAMDIAPMDIAAMDIAAMDNSATDTTNSNVANMNVVVQRMVDARVSGVVFTADPVSARRDLLIIDAVAGLGEALVSGESTPDHYGVNSAGDIVRCQLVGETPLLSEQEIAGITQQARMAAAHEGHPLDLEWAMDQAGDLFWLQARPITTLPADLNEFDSTLPRPDDVLTISNVSEMMPGAVCPLTLSFTGWGIDYGLQHMQVTVGARERIDNSWQITASAYGHLFLNLTGNVVLAAGVLGSSADQAAQTLCGRVVPELKDLPALPLWRRVVNTLKLLRYCLAAPGVVQRFGGELDQFAIEEKPGSAAMWEEIAGKSWFFDHAMAVHIQSSALSGFLCAIVENMVSGKTNDSTVTEQAEAVRLLAGASGVESALMLEQLDELLDRVAQHPDAELGFQHAGVEEAAAWLRSDPGLARGFEDFLNRHGHRGYRELCMRDPCWGDDPGPLIQSMQAAVYARRLAGGRRELHSEDIDWSALSRGLRWILPRAHNAIRRREHTKSRLVELAHRFKQAFRCLGERMAEEGTLPDADLVFFFSTSEMAAFLARPCALALEQARARRSALDYQQQLEFPEISVGLPQPLEPQPVAMTDEVLRGRPAARGVAEGKVRVAHTLQEAAALQPGEILVTPITDIGWTPYFSLIGGLVTDLGSSVSHGAVIAREYGLPCVVNTGQATRFLETGNRVRLDGDTGSVTLLSR